MAAGNETQDYLKQAGAVVAAAYNAAMRGGEVQAFIRQGFNELGAATKAFPDSLQIDEPGTVFNPLYSDIAADKRSHMDGADAAPASLPSPGEIGGGKPSASIYGQTPAVGRDLPSPSEIARDQQPYQPDQGQDHGQDRGGRGM